jgi:hypothetical protein
MFRCFEDSNFRIRIHWRGRFYGARLAGSKQLFQLASLALSVSCSTSPSRETRVRLRRLQGHSPFSALLNWTEVGLKTVVNPLDGTNYLDTVSAFIEGFLHLLAGEGSGEGTAFESLSAVVLSKSSRCSHTMAALRDSAGPGLDLLLELFGRSIAQRRVQPQPIVILLDELFDCPDTAAARKRNGARSPICSCRVQLRRSTNCLSLPVWLGEGHARWAAQNSR